MPAKKKTNKRPARTKLRPLKPKPLAKAQGKTARKKKAAPGEVIGRLVFSAPLYSPMKGKGWTFLDLPADSAERLGSRARVAVRGTINGHFFRTSVAPSGKGHHTLMVNGEMREGAGGVKAGDTVEVVIEVDTQPRNVDLPGDFASAIAANDRACAKWAAFSYSHRKAYVEWVVEAKQAATRVRRIDQAVAMIRKGETR